MVKTTLHLCGPIDVRRLFEFLRVWSITWSREHPPMSSNDAYLLRKEFVSDDEFCRILWAGQYNGGRDGVLIVLDLGRGHRSGEKQLTIRPHYGSYVGVGLLGLIPIAISTWIAASSGLNESTLPALVLVWIISLYVLGNIVFDLWKHIHLVARTIQDAIEAEFGVASTQG